MPIILVTGSKGFIGMNLCVALQRRADIELLTFNSDNTLDELVTSAKSADIIFHLAGINRPNNNAEFLIGNTILTQKLCNMIANSGKRIPIVLSSSIQAEVNTLYGHSKYASEKALVEYNKLTGSPVYIYRFPNVFGKWSKPNYNTVVATFCYNITHGLPVKISNRGKIIRFLYVDDIVKAFLGIIDRDRHDTTQTHYEIADTYSINLGELYDLLVEFAKNRRQGLIPDLENSFTKHLYSTFLSFHDASDLAYPASLKSDTRGWLLELIKSPKSGQIFVSSTQPGAIRGNHYHDSKVEKFCVIKGQGIIRLRSVLGGEVIEYHVNGKDIQIIDIPPGYTHSIENTSDVELLTLFWASEIFESHSPDTWPENVLP